MGLLQELERAAALDAERLANEKARLDLLKEQHGLAQAMIKDAEEMNRKGEEAVDKARFGPFVRPGGNGKPPGQLGGSGGSVPEGESGAGGAAASGGAPPEGTVFVMTKGGLIPVGTAPPAGQASSPANPAHRPMGSGGGGGGASGSGSGSGGFLPVSFDFAGRPQQGTLAKGTILDARGNPVDPAEAEETEGPEPILGYRYRTMSSQSSGGGGGSASSGGGGAEEDWRRVRGNTSIRSSADGQSDMFQGWKSNAPPPAPMVDPNRVETAGDKSVVKQLVRLERSIDSMASRVERAVSRANEVPFSTAARAAGVF